VQAQASRAIAPTPQARLPTRWRAFPGARFLIFETLAERTLAQSQLDRRRDAARGYNPALERFVGPVLARCLRDGIKIIGNFGAANPSAAAARIQAMAHAQGSGRRIRCRRRR
jgi:hypothetical protein